MTCYAIIFTDDIEIFNLTKIERKASINILSDLSTGYIFSGIFQFIIRNKNSDIYVIESDGDINDLYDYYLDDPTDFTNTVKSVGKCLYQPN